MFQDMIKEINGYRRDFLRYLLLMLIGTIGLVFLGLIFLSEWYISLICFTSVLVLIVTCIITMKRINRQAHQFKQERLYPKMIKRVNVNWRYRGEGLIKEEMLKSLIINKAGTFHSKYQINGSLDQNNQFAISNVTNIITTGKTTYEIFNGIILTCSLNHPVQGVLQVRTKGSPNNYKKRGLVTKRYKLDAFDKMRVYATEESLVTRYANSNLITLYRFIEQYFKGDMIISLHQNKLTIGVRDRKNIIEFGILERITDEKVNKKIENLNNIEKTLNQMSKYIQKS